MTTRRLSIVVVAIDAGASLSRVLRALAPQLDANMDLLVVVPEQAAGRAEAAIAAAPAGAARAALVTGRTGATRPELRTLGLRRATGQLIALLADTYVPGPSWAHDLRLAHDRHPDAGVIVGAIEPEAGATLVAWSRHVAEYGPFMNPVGPVRGPLPAANAAFRADVARLVTERFPQGAWETAWNRLLSEHGIPVVLDGSIAVRHVADGSPWEYLAERYDYSRSITAERLAGAGAWRRAIHACASPLLPFVLVARMWRGAGHRREHRWRFLRAVPWLIVYSSCGAAGECVAALTGRGPARSRA